MRRALRIFCEGLFFAARGLCSHQSSWGSSSSRGGVAQRLASRAPRADTCPANSRRQPRDASITTRGRRIDDGVASTASRPAFGIPPAQGPTVVLPVCCPHQGAKRQCRGPGNGPRGQKGCPRRQKPIASSTRARTAAGDGALSTTRLISSIACRCPRRTTGRPRRAASHPKHRGHTRCT